MVGGINSDRQKHAFYSRCLQRTRKQIHLLFLFFFNKTIEMLRFRTCTVPLPSNEYVLMRILPPLPPPEYDPSKFAPLALKVPSMSKVSLILRKKMPPPRPPAPPAPLPPLLPVHKKKYLVLLAEKVHSKLIRTGSAHILRALVTELRELITTKQVSFARSRTHFNWPNWRVPFANWPMRFASSGTTISQTPWNFSTPFPKGTFNYYCLPCRPLSVVFQPCIEPGLM